jgi:hypothetical protein
LSRIEPYQQILPFIHADDQKIAWINQPLLKTRRKSTSTDPFTLASAFVKHHVLFVSAKEKGMERNPGHFSGFTAAKMGGYVHYFDVNIQVVIGNHFAMLLLHVQRRRYFYHFCWFVFLEQTLGTHDLAIPLPQYRQNDQQDFFRLILLSSTDVQTPTAEIARIERLYNQTGGQHVGIVFLIQENTSNGNGTSDFMKLQARWKNPNSSYCDSLLTSVSLLSSFEIPILPLAAVTSLQTLLFTFQRQLVHTRREASVPRANARVTLLPFCSTNPPIPEHARNIVSDMYPNIPYLAQAATTPDGQQDLRRWLSGTTQGVAKDIIGFWEQEFIAE